MSTTFDVHLSSTSTNTAAVPAPASTNSLGSKVLDVMLKVFPWLGFAASTVLFFATQGHPLAFAGMILFGTWAIISVTDFTFSSTISQTYRAATPRIIPTYVPPPAPTVVITPQRVVPVPVVVPSYKPAPPVYHSAPIFTPTPVYTPPPAPPVNRLASTFMPTPFTDRQTINNGFSPPHAAVGRNQTATPRVEEWNARADTQTIRNGVEPDHGRVGRNQVSTPMVEEWDGTDEQTIHNGVEPAHGGVGRRKQ